VLESAHEPLEAALHVGFAGALPGDPLQIAQVGQQINAPAGEDSGGLLDRGDSAQRPPTEFSWDMLSVGGCWVDQ